MHPTDWIGWIGYAILFRNCLQYGYKKIVSDPSDRLDWVDWIMLSCFVTVCNIALPKRRFWKIEQSVAFAFLNEFSSVRSLHLVFTSFKSAIKSYTQRFVRPSKLVV
jgi:hypothetical protein